MSMEIECQIKAIKRLEKKLPVRWCEDKDFTYLAVSSESAVRIPNDRFFLDKSKIKENKSLKNIFNVRTEELYRLKETNFMRKYTRGIAKKFDVVETEDDVYVEVKILRELLVKRTEFFASKNKRFVYLVSDNEIYAVIVYIPFIKPEEYEC